MDDETTSSILAERITLVDRVGHALNAISTKDPRSVDKEERALVISIILLVAELRLPGVLTRLAAVGRIHRDIADILIPHLLHGDADCVIELIRGSRPMTATKLQDAEDKAMERAAAARREAPKRAPVEAASSRREPARPASESMPGSSAPPTLGAVVRNARYPALLGRTKWDAITRLLISLGIAPESSKPKAIQVSFSESQFNIGDLADASVRCLAWDRLASFIAAIGLGQVTRVHMETAYAALKIDETPPQKAPPAVRKRRVKDYGSLDR